MKKEKICSKCGLLKKSFDFSISYSKKSNKYYLRSCCKDCRLLEYKKVAETKKNKKHPPIENLEGEIWRPIKRYEGLYEVSNLGRIKSLKRIVTSKNRERLIAEKILKPVPGGKGYIRITLSKNGISILATYHRLVADAFIPNPENKPQVNHKKGLKWDNRASELEWCTASENQLHSFRIGLAKPPQGGKGRFDSLNGSSKPVIQVSLDGFIIGEYESRRGAMRATGIKSCYIDNVVSGRQKTAGGYYWK